MLQRFVQADSASRSIVHENLNHLANAINVTLVYLGVRKAARLDEGDPSDMLIASIRRNKLIVVDWSGDNSEPIVVRASDKVSRQLCEQMRGLDGEHSEIMGRLLGYGCDFAVNPISECWVLNFVVYGRCLDNIGHLDQTWLAGFKCCRKNVDLVTLLSKYNKEFVGPANHHLAGTTVRSGNTGFLIDHFAIKLDPPRHTKKR